MSDEFNFFDSEDFDSEIFVDETERRKASKQEKTELLEFIGGFSKWSDLDEDTQMHIINQLDFRSKCSLSICSKSNNRLVKEAILFKNDKKNDGIRMRFHNLKAMFKSDSEQKKQENVTVKKMILRDNYIEVHTSSNFIRSWRLSQYDSDVSIVSKSVKKPEFTFSNTLTVSNSTIEVEFSKIFNKTIGNSVENLEVNLKKNPQIEFQLENLKVFQFVFYDSIELLKYWVDRLTPNTKLEYFYLKQQYWYRRQSCKIPFEVINHPAIINATHLKIPLQIEMSDEQFFTLKASRLVLSTKELFPAQCFELIRRWVDDELDFDMKQCFIDTEQNFFHNLERILDQFDATEYRWTDSRIQFDFELPLPCIARSLDVCRTSLLPISSRIPSTQHQPSPFQDNLVLHELLLLPVLFFL
uniref:F-box domain-containing protein n=1 Tax=Caenorhabditis tropicalis TaxID=1561998 RepID=A0A1I7TPH2_9PELO